MCNNFNTLNFFNRKYSFRTIQESNDYFNNSLKLSVTHYINELKAFNEERIHIVLSWIFFFKYAMYATIILAISNAMLLGISNILFSLSIISFIITSILKRKLQNYSRGFELTMLLCNDKEALEEIRKEL